MYGKVMSVPDKAMGLFMRLITRWTPSQINDIEAGFATGTVHPRDAKMMLAGEITQIYYSPEQAAAAEEHFKRVFQQGSAPEEMVTFKLRANISIIDVLVESGLAGSKSEARRLIDQNGVRLDGETLHEANSPFPHSGVLQAGKRKFLRVID
jgi:tyrosyl-tRNA synthetase